MDSMDLERERGITIAAKNCSVVWKGVKINILDTPGHADFGGEVERALSMVDGAVLLVDASEGPLPQTRFVLEKALAGRLSIIVVINKIDRPGRPPRPRSSTRSMTCSSTWASPRSSWSFPSSTPSANPASRRTAWPARRTTCTRCFDAIVREIPAPRYTTAEPFQMLVSDLSYSDYFGRQAIGKVINGRAHSKDALVCIGDGDVREDLNVSKLQTYAGAKLVETDGAEPGDIVVLSGIENVHIGDTICNREFPRP